MTRPRILFLDEDHVVRVLRLLLSNAEDDPSVRAFFAPEEVDLAALLAAAAGLRQGDGAAIGQGVHFGDADAIIFRRGSIDAALIAKHPRLRLIQRFGERPEGIDLAAAAAHGVKVSCLPRPTINYTAEHVILLMLALGKRLLQGDRAVREGSGSATPTVGRDGAYNWAGLVGATGLHGKTLGIVGMGEVGILVAKLARAFGMNVLYHNRTRVAPAIEQAIGAVFAPLSELLECADHVSLNAANLPQNARMANAAFFSVMRRSAFFINTSRGRLVDEDALYVALERGVIAGAALDVHAVEPRPAGDRFAALPNVILTPHLGGGARSGVLAEFAVIVHNCHAALRGEPVLHEKR